MGDKKSGKPAQRMADLAKHIGIEGVVVIPPFPISAYNVEKTDVKKQDILTQNAFCVTGLQSVDLSGSSSTGANGRKTWRLSDNMCLYGGETWYRFEGPVSFVATPVADRPTYITVTVEIQASPNDLVVEVYSWDNHGNPSPNVRFCWRCRLSYTYTYQPIG